jgi:tol-pal system protein YbgF
MRMWIGCASLSLALITLAGCASTPEEDPVLQDKLSNLDSRTARIERVMSNQSLLNMAQTIDGLQEQVRVLQGRIDELENTNEALRKQQLAFYSDLDRRISQLSSGGGGGGGGGGGAGAGGSAATGAPSAVAPGTEQSAYMAALDQLKKAQYPEAIDSLQQFLATYPRSQLADNAQYWIGEAYYASHDYPKAATAFQGMLDQFPSSRKAPDALLKLGYTQFQLKEYDKARTTLVDVTKRYPGSNAAKLATTQLHALSGGGGAGGGSGSGSASSGTDSGAG